MQNNMKCMEFWAPNRVPGPKIAAILGPGLVLATTFGSGTGFWAQICINVFRSILVLEIYNLLILFRYFVPGPFGEQ